MTKLPNLAEAGHVAWQPGHPQLHIRKYSAIAAEERLNAPYLLAKECVRHLPGMKMVLAEFRLYFCDGYRDQRDDA